MIAEILVILALIVLNGVLAMSELAIVSARPARLKPLETQVPAVHPHPLVRVAREELNPQLAAFQTIKPALRGHSEEPFRDSLGRH